MEYPKLHEDEKKRLTEALKKRDRLTALIAEAREVLQKHLALAEKKGDAFALYEAYMDDGQDDEDYEGDEEAEYQIAQCIWEDEGLGRIHSLVENKAGAITELESEELQKGAEVESIRELLKRIARFNPSVIQSKRHKYLSRFDTNMKPKDWLRENRGRRHEQGKQTNSLLKVIMDIFVRAEYRGLPRDRSADFDDPAFIEPIPFDPARISDSLLEGLELDLPQEGTHELERLKHKLSLIPALKEILARCAPLSITNESGAKKNYRLLVVGAGKGKEGGNAGKIIIPRYDTSALVEERQKVPSVFNSAYSAHRQAEHVFAKYRRESELVANAKAKAETLHKRLLQLKSDDPDYVEEKAAIITGLNEIVDRLEGSITLYKRVSYESLRSAANLKDSRGRENLGASRAKMVKVLERLQKRLNEAVKTALAFPENSKTLEGVINRSENIFAQYDLAFADYLATGNTRQFEALKGSLQKLNVRPFNLYAGKLMGCIERMNSSNGNRVEIRRAEATKALAITRLFEIQKKVEDLVFNIDVNGANTGIDLNGFITQITENCPSCPHSAVFYTISRGLRGLIDAQTGTAKLKEGLKAIDFEELLSNIE